MSWTLSKGLLLEEGLILQPVVSGRRLSGSPHGFWGRIRGHYNILGFSSKESDALSREGEGPALEDANLPLVTDAFNLTRP